MAKKLSASKLDVEKGISGGIFTVSYAGSSLVKNDGLAAVKDAHVFLSHMHLTPTIINFEVCTDALYFLSKKDKNEIFKRVLIANIQCLHIEGCVISVLENDPKLKQIICHSIKCAKVKEAHELACSTSYMLKVFSREAEPATDKKKFPTSLAKFLKDSKETPKFVVNKGDRLQMFLTTWIGDVTVKRNATEFTAEDGLKILQQSTLSHEKPVTVGVYDKRIVVTNNIDNQPCSEMATLELVSIKLLLGDTTLVVVGNAPNQVGHLYVFGVRNPKVEAPNPSLRRTLFTAWQDVVADQKKKHDALDQDAILGKLQQSLCCALLGVAPYPKDYKPDRATDKNTMVKVAFTMFRKDEKRFVVVNIGSNACVIYDSLTGYELARFTIPQISVSTTLTGPGGELLYGFAIKDMKSGLHACYCLLMDDKTSKSLETTMDGLAQGKSSNLADDPFKAVGGRVPAPKDLFIRQIHRRHLRAVKPIGSGQFGQVYLAMQTIEVNSQIKEVKRAVKTLKGEVTEAARDEFVHEAEIMLKINHRNCVELIGVACQQRPWLMALEFLENGDLLLVLKGCAQSKIELSPAEQLHLSWQPCSGLAYLASRRLLHMDIAARNCLVGKDNLVKISDFGMTKKLPSTSPEFVPTISIKVPVKWCAIEILEERRFSEASDVWACGVLLWEIMSRGAQPFEGILQANIAKYLKQGNRLASPPLGFQPLYKVAQQCWMEKRGERPTFDALNTSIKKLLRDLTKQNPDTEIRDLAATVSARKNPKDPRLSTGELKRAASSIVMAMEVDGDGSTDGPISDSPSQPETNKAPAKKNDKNKETPPQVEPSDVGKRCVVQGYDCEGVLTYVGPAQGSKDITCGVILDRKIGRNNGSVRGHKYFECEQGYGVMCNPDKITLLQSAVMFNNDPYASPLSPPAADIKSRLRIDDDEPGSAQPEIDDEEEQTDTSKWVMGDNDDDLMEPDPIPSTPSKVDAAENSLSKAMRDLQMEEKGDDNDIKRRLSFLNESSRSNSTNSTEGFATKKRDSIPSLNPVEKAERRKQIEEEVAAKLAVEGTLPKSLRAGMQAQQEQAKKAKWGADADLAPSVLRSTFFKAGSEADKPTGTAWFDGQTVEPTVEKEKDQELEGFGFN